MIRLANSPSLLDFTLRNPGAQQWLNTVTERFSVYQSAADPTLTDLNERQWAVWYNTATAALNVWVNIGGVLHSISGGGGGGTGTVTSVSVATANGFSGTVATATTTPVITMKTSITGLLKGNGTAISAATAGVDYPSGTGSCSGANTGDQTITLTSDVTGTGTGSFATTIAAGVVTYAKMQNISASSRLLSRITAGAGSPEEATISQALDFVGSAANGDILSRQAGTWNRLAIGTTGQVLTVTGGVPAWGSNELQLANVTLGVAGTSLSAAGMTACKFLRVEIYISGYAGSDTASLQFNGSGGTAYRYRWLTCAAAATTFTAGLVAASTDRIKVAAVNTTLSRRVVAFISNDSTNTEKMVTFSEATGTGSAATQGTLDMGHGAWVSGASTSITQIALISSSNMNAGTQMTIYGWN